MDPVTVALLLLAGVAAVSVLTWKAVRSWLVRKRARQADLIRTALENGEVSVVVIGLNDHGTEVGRRTWRAKQLDSELESTFGYSDRIRVNT